MARLSYDPEALKPIAVSDSGFVFDPRTGHSYSMNATGLATLKAMREGRPTHEIAALLRDAFDGGLSIEDDLELFLGRLREYGLIGPAIKAQAEEAS